MGRTSIVNPDLTIGGWKVLQWEQRTDGDWQVSTTPERDPDWRGQCSNGHANSWETLRWIKDDEWFCPECRDFHDEGHYECGDCSEEMSGGIRDPKPEWVPRMREVSATALAVESPELFNLVGTTVEGDYPGGQTADYIVVSIRSYGLAGSECRVELQMDGEPR